MNEHDLLKDVYKDFFGVESIDINKDSSSEEQKQVDMKKIFDDINSLYITEESKELLKKIIEYMRKYNEKIEGNYVNFSLVLKINNEKTREAINDILYTASINYNYIDNKDKLSLSLYKIKDKYDLSKPCFLRLYDIKGLSLESDTDNKKFIYDIEDYLKNDKKKVVIIEGSSDEVDTFFLGCEDFKNKYFNYVIDGINPDIQDVYNYVLDKTKIDDNLKVSLLDYLSKTYDTDCDYVEYQDKLVKYLSFNKELPKIETNKTMEEIFKELEELVGLKKVKKVLYELVDVMKLKEKAGDDLKIKDINLHMVFLGNPGTGKTTIARIIAGILYELGYVKENKLIEVSVKDLVAEYVGQTAPKTMSVIEKAMNGVLFIDEAYTLAVGHDNTYNAEAIATLIQAMENYRDKLVVIFAGYTKEMQDFLNSNSGIVSRIGYTLEFDDYTTDELVEIFMGMVKKNGFEIEDKAIDYLRKIIDDNRNVKNFGNARFVRNIYEKTVVKHASRVKDKKQKKKLITITKEDINIENLKLD